MSTPNTEILYVEDNVDYAEFVKRAIHNIDSHLELGVVREGKTAIEQFNHPDAENLPKLILLDLHLEDHDGFEILYHIRHNDLTRYIPVVMLSASENPDDMKKAFDCGANAYLVKPNKLLELSETLNSICNFWLQHHKTIPAA